MEMKINANDSLANPKYARANKIDRLRNKNTLKWTSLKSRGADPLQFAPVLKDQRRRASPEIENITINATDGARNENGID
jgi:hypothetical protein